MVLASRIWEILALISEGFEDKDGKKSVYYYINKKIKRNKFTISNDPYDRAMEIKELKISQGT